jgi:hypothetical protein
MHVLQSSVGTVSSIPFVHARGLGKLARSGPLLPLLSLPLLSPPRPLVGNELEWREGCLGNSPSTGRMTSAAWLGPKVIASARAPWFRLEELWLKRELRMGTGGMSVGVGGMGESGILDTLSDGVMDLRSRGAGEGALITDSGGVVGRKCAGEGVEGGGRSVSDSSIRPRPCPGLREGSWNKELLGTLGPGSPVRLRV